MHHSRPRIFLMLLAVVALVVVLPETASAAGPCASATPANTPDARANLWRSALVQFSAAHPNLTAEQAQFITQAARLGDQIANVPDDARAQASVVRNAKRMVERSRELFTNAQLGEIFSSMGPLQIWLSAVSALSTPYCDCAGAGSCTMPGGPSGTCSAGCISWDGGGTRYDGLCGSAQME